MSQKESEQIIRTEYSDVMKKSYIDYAMSVIVSRALPDVRDGLKPVQRRTLYDMYELGIRYDRPYRKCARIVGDTMGKYHPHGDRSIYEALVVMAQDFKKGMVMVDGHGNFGSIEGDGAAAMRYTEARLAKVTQEAFLADLDKDIVNFVPNFDETEKEPEVLPVRFPNLLVNGAEGIAVGMATSIPTHNLGEVIDAVKAYMKNNAISTKQLMKYLKGPDFPTGGIVVNQDDLLQIYETGSGKIKLRGKVEIEELKGGKKRLVITEIPYTMIGSGIGKFLNDVCALVETKKTSDIVDISNQSSKEGIRIVIDLKKDADVENLTNMLYKKTKLEDTFGVNMLAVADGKPETMGLKKIIEYHVDFQFEITTRKYRTLLAKEQEKREVQEGLIKACDVIDLIIEILRGSRSVKDAKACLMYGVTDEIQFKSKTSEKMAKLLSFTERQATAILEMRLYRLIGLEIEALQKEHEETIRKIERYEKILNDYDEMSAVIIEDLNKLKKEYVVKRRTLLENAEEAVYEEKKIEEQEVICLVDRFGYARTVDPSVYERNQDAADAESRYIIRCMNTGKLCLFTAEGRMHQIKVLDIPHGKFRDKGLPVDNISNYDSTEEHIVTLMNEADLEGEVLLFATKDGLVKRVAGSEFLVSKRTTAATKLQEDDELRAVLPMKGQDFAVLQTENGYFLKFPAEDVSEKKKGALGIRGIRLQKKDAVEHAYVFAEGTETKAVYKEKEISLNRLKTGKRDTSGVKQRV